MRSDQLEQLARAVEKAPLAEESHEKQAFQQEQPFQSVHDEFMFGTTEPYTSQSSSETPGQHPYQPDDSFTDLVTNVYFDKWYFAAPMFQRARYSMSLHLPPHMRPPMCLQYIVMALGADITKTHRKLAIPFYQRARAYMQADEMRGDGQHFTSVAHAQAWSLIANFEAQQLFFAQSSMSLCRAIRISQMLGLHRVDGQSVDAIPLLSPPRDWVEAEERRRTWWVIYCSDRLVCGSTGWPAMINEHDSSHNISDEEAQDVKTSLHWKRHREIDNDLASLLNCLPDDLKLPNSIRCQNATFVNIIIHTSIILLHRAALSTIERVGTPHHMIRQCRIRLVAAAEEILNILRMMPDVNDMLKNPMLTFSMYMASLVFLDQPTSTEPEYQRQDNLDFTLRLMILAAKTWGNPVTRSMAIQLAVDMRQRGLDSAAVEKATELPVERSTVPILAKGDNDSSNFLFQLNNFENSPEPIADI
ncbi:binuclear zinc transcription factor [Colletotrichum asianum]